MHEPRSPDRPRRVVPPSRARRRAHARRLDDDLRRPAARLTTSSATTSSRACTWSPASARSSRSSPSTRAGRSGSTTRTSTSTTTSATRRCRRRATRSSCGTSPRGPSRRASTARSRSGSCGWSTASPSDRFAIVCKSHHCLVDGVSGVDITTVLFDAEPDPAPADPRPEWVPRPEPSELQLLGAALTERATQPAEVMRGARALIRRPLQGPGRDPRRGRGHRLDRRPGTLGPRLAAQRRDRPPPPLRLGPRRPRRPAADQGRRTAARSTTSS